MNNDKVDPGKKDKEMNLSFYKDGYSIASQNITDFKSLTPLFKGMQIQYTEIGKLIQSFAQRTHEQNKPIACSKGCKWCCFQPVYLTTQEAILINEFVLQSFDKAKLASLKSKAQKKLKKTKDLTEEGKQKIKHACPFLFENACSIYPVRPMACRIYLSSDVESCKRNYEATNKKDEFPALFDFILRAGRYMNEGFVGFLKGKGRKIEEKTMEEFTDMLLSNPDYFESWLKQDSFNDEAKETP
ncbi:YkgJ family cysteine cluster protein [Labilibacter sediminis]|nr:YkgJ family cysteine cluster protein [Labilibacter sediminis]